MEKSIFNRMLLLTFGFLTLGGCLVPTYGKKVSVFNKTKQIEKEARGFFGKTGISLKCKKLKNGFYKFDVAYAKDLKDIDKNVLETVKDALKQLFASPFRCKNVDSFYDEIAERILVNRDVCYLSGNEDDIQNQVKDFVDDHKSHKVQGLLGGFKLLSIPDVHGEHAALYREVGDLKGNMTVTFIYGNKDANETEEDSISRRIFGLFSRKTTKKIFDYALAKAKKSNANHTPRGLKVDAADDCNEKPQRNRLDWNLPLNAAGLFRNKGVDLPLKVYPFKGHRYDLWFRDAWEGNPEDKQAVTPEDKQVIWDNYANLFGDHCWRGHDLKKTIAERTTVNRNVSYISGNTTEIRKKVKDFVDDHLSGHHNLQNIPGGLKLLRIPGHHGGHAALYREEENPTTGQSEVTFIYGRTGSESETVSLKILGLLSDDMQKRIFDCALLKAKERNEVGFPKGLKMDAAADAGDR